MRFVIVLIPAHTCDRRICSAHVIRRSIFVVAIVSLSLSLFLFGCITVIVSVYDQHVSVFGQLME